jgi:nucleoside-diphosphate-sugar epimerase
MILVTGGPGFIGSHTARALPGLPRWHNPGALISGAARQNRRQERLR